MKRTENAPAFRPSPEEMGLYEKEAREIIRKSAENPEKSIGKGRVASVCESEKYPNVCYKIIPSWEENPLENSIREEMAFLDDLSALEVGGVRTPEPYFLIEQDGFFAIAMERFMGRSLKDIVEEKTEAPADFDADEFFSEVLGYVAAMHEKGVYHRDLHDGNILVDERTGKPRLIDFGRSGRTVPKEENPYDARDKRSGKKIETFDTDEDSLKKTKQAFAAALGKIKKKK